MGDPLAREVLLAFWKIHILHHAAAGPIYGLWMIEELAEHGYHLSPGTLYPLLQRMERNGWLKSTQPEQPNSRRNFQITPEGRAVLERLRQQVTELYNEVVLEVDEK